MSIYEANPTKTLTNVPIEQLNECYNKFENITSKSNDEIKKIQEENGELEYIPRFLKQLFVFSITDFTQYFKPKVSPYGKVEMNISLNEEYANYFLDFGENFRNYVFNNTYKLTGKMPECIEMGIEEEAMKFKLQFRESMPSYEKIEPTEKYSNFFNTILMKKDEQYGLSSFISVQFQLMKILIEVFERTIPDYFENESKLIKIINDTDYIVCDFEKVQKDKHITIHYNYELILDMKRLKKDIDQELPDDIKTEKIKELREKLLKFDETHWTYEKLNSNMAKNKRNQIVATEISPTMLVLSNYKFNEIYEQNPNMKNEEYIDNGVFYFKPQEYIKAKKEMRNDTPTISKATKSRYVFYFKLLIFDERSVQKASKTVRPNYLKNMKEIKKEDEVKDEIEDEKDNSNDINLNSDSIEVPDSDEEN